MKPLLFFKIALSALLITGMNSCNKTNDEPSSVNRQPSPPPGNGTPSFEVEYIISPVSDNFSRISYNDEHENTINNFDLTGFWGGTKLLMVSAHTYTARLSVVVNNATDENMEYHLIIMVNGVVKQDVKDFAAARSSNHFTSASYTVEFK
jgi:hypothetical protein